MYNQHWHFNTSDLFLETDYKIIRLSFQFSRKLLLYEHGKRIKVYLNFILGNREEEFYTFQLTSGAICTVDVHINQRFEDLFYIQPASI